MVPKRSLIPLELTCLHMTRLSPLTHTSLQSFETLKSWSKGWEQMFLGPEAVWETTQLYLLI